MIVGVVVIGTGMGVGGLGFHLQGRSNRTQSPTDRDRSDDGENATLQRRGHYSLHFGGIPPVS